MKVKFLRDITQDRKHYHKGDVVDKSEVTCSPRYYETVGFDEASVKKADTKKAESKSKGHQTKRVPGKK